MSGQIALAKYFFNFQHTACSTKQVKVIAYLQMFAGTKMVSHI